jgi:hypothetical protein
VARLSLNAQFCAVSLLGGLGLILNSATGQINGIPTAPGTYSFNVTAEGSNALSIAKSLTITIAAPPAPTSLVKSLFDFAIGDCLRFCGFQYSMFRTTRHDVQLIFAVDEFTGDK